MPTNQVRLAELFPQEQILNQRLSIERLVFIGGGAKGVVYPGAYHAMVRTGAFEDVKEVSGSSVGSLTAALVALGMPPDDLRKFLNFDYSSLMGDRVGSYLGANPPGVRFITKDGKGILENIRLGIAETIRTYFGDMADIELFLQNNPDICEFWNRIKSTRSPIVTFRDLALLNKIDPKRFKRLTVTGVVHPTAELQIFNAEQTPDVEVALACRASSSIPVLLEPVEIQIGSDIKRFVDGGVYDNVPTDYFDVDASTGEFISNQKKNRTLIFMLDEEFKEANSPVFHAIHGSRAAPYQMGRNEKMQRTVGLRRVADMKLSYCSVKRKEDEYKKLRDDYALRTVDLIVSPVGTTDFKMATRLLRTMLAFGYLDTVNYLINHDLHHDCASNVDFNAESFHPEIVQNFCEIYSAVRLGSGHSLQDDKLWKKLNAPGITLLQRYALIRNAAGNVWSTAGFALTRAVEFANNQITSEELFKETYRESFKRSSFFSVSKITGECIFQTKTLTHQLKAQNMFGLFDKRKQEHRSKTRTDDIFESLNKLDKFNHDYEAYEDTIATSAPSA